MKILFLTAYSKSGASSRTRVYDYYPYFKKNGIDFICICFSLEYLHILSQSDRAIDKLAYKVSIIFLRLFKILQSLIYAPFYDIVFIQKITFPFYLEKILRLLNKNIIFDFDDAIFTHEDTKDNFLNKAIFYFQKVNFINMLKVAKCCIVENDYNKNIALQFCPFVEIITGPIDTEKYFIKKKDGVGSTVIGWTGSKSTTKYLYEIKDALKEIFDKYDVIFKFIGAKDNFKIHGVNFQIEKWDLKNEVSQIQSFDIGIMPLPENDWTKGKGGYKLLQYMASGIPAVASPVEINKEIIEDGINGFLAENRNEWVEKISILIEDRELRKKMGLLARKKMEEEYSLINASKKIIDIFKIIKSNGKDNT